MRGEVQKQDVEGWGSSAAGHVDVQGSSSAAPTEVSNRLTWSLHPPRQLKGEGGNYLFACLSTATREYPQVCNNVLRKAFPVSLLWSSQLFRKKHHGWKLLPNISVSFTDTNMARMSEVFIQWHGAENCITSPWTTLSIVLFLLIWSVFQSPVLHNFTFFTLLKNTRQHFIPLHSTPHYFLLFHCILRTPNWFIPYFFGTLTIHNLVMGRTFLYFLLKFIHFQVFYSLRG